MPSVKVKVGDEGRRTQDAAKEQGAGDDGVDNDSMRKEVQAQKVHSQCNGVLWPVHSCASAFDEIREV